MYDARNLPTNGDAVLTVKRAESTDKSNNQDNVKVALAKDGLGARIKGGHDWKTKVTWKKVDDATGDGTGVEATMLGPDHTAGESPSSKTRICKNAWALNKYLTGGKFDSNFYVKGHLLNGELGGPGNDSRNLAAIPYAANNPAMSDNVEKPLKKIVNEQKGWIYYKVDITHADSTKSPLRYASKITAAWHELEADAAGAAQKVAGTEGTAVIDIPDVTAHGNCDYSQPTSGMKKGATYHQKNATPCIADAKTAKAELPWNAIVLRSWAYANKLRDALNAAEPIIEEIKKTQSEQAAQAAATELSAALDSGPGGSEALALDWLTKELDALKGDPDRSPDPKLMSTIDDYRLERKARIDDVLVQVEGVLRTHDVTGAAGHLAKIKKLLKDSDPLEVYRGLIGAVAERNERLQKKQEATEMSYDDYRAATMSPQSAYDLDEELHHDDHVKDPQQARKRLREATSKPEKGERGKVHQTIDLKKPTYSAKSLSTAIGNLVGTLSPAKLDPLKAVHLELHTVAVAVLEGRFSPSIFTWMIDGLQKEEPLFMKVLHTFRTIPEVESAFLEAQKSFT